MLTPYRPRQHTARPSLPPPTSTPPRVAPPVWEGDCPSARCRGTYPLTPAGQLPEHPVAAQWTCPHRCPCSGWLARNPRPRQHVTVEGVRWL